MVLDLGNYEVLGVVMYNLTWALLAEVMCWFFIYSSPKFKNLKIQIEKHLAKVDDGKDSSSKSNKKREARLQPWREEASKQFMSIQFKTGIIAMVALISSYKLLWMLFSPGPIAKLPFEPPSLIRKATLRGLPADTDPRLCSTAFIFVLCQGSIKLILAKVLGWGPTREMMAVKPYVPKALKADVDASLGTRPSKKDR